MDEFAKFKKEIKDVVHNENIKLALSRAINSYRNNLEQALKKFPHTIKLAEEVRNIKEKSISEIEKMIELARNNLEENKAKTYFASTAEEALEIVGTICGANNKTIVKAKSMTSEEIELREFLEKAGHQVYETDLGEFIIQKLGTRPMHILSPAIHVTKEEVADLFSKLINKKLPKNDINILVKTAKTLLREKFFKADIGISGANVIAAETGTLFLIENEGNIRLSTGTPDIHIAIIGIEKIVPSLSDAYKVAEVTWRYANYTVPSYVSLISGPSKTGDIEKVITYGAHGPSELHIVFLDNGRSKLSKDPVLKEALYCLRCGGCLYECPVFGITAGHFGDKYFAGIGAVWAVMISNNVAKGSAMAYTCLTCGRCKERCPVKIDIPQMILEIRKRLVETEK